MNRVEVIAVDERLENLLEMFCSDEPAVNASRAFLIALRFVLITLWNAKKVRCRNMIFDQYAVRDILCNEILPEHIQRMLNRFGIRDFVQRRNLVAMMLFEEIICGSAVMSIAGDYYGHTWSAAKERHSSSEVNLYRKTEKLFSDTQRTVHA